MDINDLGGICCDLRTTTSLHNQQTPSIAAALMFFASTMLSQTEGVTALAGLSVNLTLCECVPPSLPP